MSEEKYFLSFEDFQFVVDSLIGTPLKEIQFSGGEPFLNTDTIKMIEFVDKNTDYEIGCATNAACLNETIISQLSKTRIKLNIQFPATTQEDFNKITRTGNLKFLSKQLQLLQRYNVPFGLNHCINELNCVNVNSVIEFAKNNDLPLKLLPNLNNKKSISTKKEIFAFLDKMFETKKDIQTGTIKWTGESNFQIKYIDSPCFYKDFEKCKNYAEIRLQPDLTLQPCIMKHSNSSTSLKGVNNDSNVRLKFQQLWNSFISC